jgi:hypothetical protein
MDTLKEDLKKIVPDCDIELTDEQLQKCVEKALDDIKQHKENLGLRVEDLDENDQKVLAQGALALGVYRTMIEYAAKTMEINGDQASVGIDKTTADLVHLYNAQVDKFNELLEGSKEENSQEENTENKE